MKKFPIALSFGLFILLFPDYSFAWGKKGHGIVAEIAFSLLDSNIQSKVHHFLGNMTIEESSVWMDEIRGDHSFDYMKPWHYVNVEKDKQYIQDSTPNIINALNKAISQLENKSHLNDSEIKRNLLIIFHLCGDLHQPLHTGYGTDKGGNDIHIKFSGRETNLHRAWDTEIIDSTNISLNDCLALLKGYDKKQIETIKAINVVNWMNSSRVYLNDVYNFTNNTIDKDYCQRNKTIIEKQLVFAGIRLAAILEKTFG